MKQKFLTFFALLCMVVHGAWAQIEVSTESALTEALGGESPISIKLTADITLEERMHIVAGKIVILDLNGHTLSRNVTENSSFHMVIHNYGTLTVNDGSGDNSGKITGGRAYGGGGIYCEPGSTLTFNGGTITGNNVTTASGGGGFGGGILINNNVVATITGGLIVGNGATFGGGIYNQGTLTLSNNALISGNTGNYGGGIYNTGTLNFIDGTITDNLANLSSGGGIWNSGTLNMKGKPIVSGNNSTANGIDNVYLDGSSVINVTGAFTEGAKIGVRPSSTSNAFTSGYSTYNSEIIPNSFFFSDAAFHKMSLNGSGEAILIGAEGNWIDDGNRSESYSHVDGKTIYIENEAEFARLAWDINHGYNKGFTIILNADLDMSAHFWTPIGTRENDFIGHFNGNGHTISGIYVNRPNDSYNGLFGYVVGSALPSGSRREGCNYIKNFVLKDSYIKGGDRTGGVVGCLEDGLTFENVVCQADVTGGNHVGGIIGWANSPDAHNDYRFFNYTRNCLFLSGKITATGNNCAAVIGTIGAEVHRSNNYYADSESNVGNSYDVRAYPIITSIPEGVTVSYGTGITYNGMHYHPAGNVNFAVQHALSQTAVVKVNGIDVVESDGVFPFTIDPAMAESYEVIVTLNDYEFTGSGTEAEPYLIRSQADWNYFVSYLNSGSSPNNYSGTYFKLDTDIIVNQRMGTNDHPFCGTFDGDSHTLTLAFGTSENYSDKECAPFYRINNSTIQNLKIAGSIYSSAQHNASLAVKSTGSNNYIRNCISSVSINSSIDGDCTNGGFISLLNTNDTHVYFNGCAFVGELVGENATNWGGFLGWREFGGYFERSYAHFTDCLFAPTNINIATPDGSNSRTFCRSRDNKTSGASYTNSYYTTVLQAVDGGKQAYSITIGDGVTSLENAGTATIYNVSGITSYGTGIVYQGYLYAGNGDNVSLNITGNSPSDSYMANNHLLSGVKNPYTLTMAANNTIVSAWDFVPPTEIASVDDWNNFCSSISFGYDYAGKTVTMTANVGTPENPVNTIAGTNDDPFRGTFDGGSYTLTIGYGSSESYSTQECAPFYRLNNATIQNLKIAGSIYSSAQHNGGIAARATGSGNYIKNCVSRISIHSSIEGDCANGGFIGVLNNNGTHVYFEGCTFTGELVGTSATNWGGFVGWREYYASSFEQNQNFVSFTDCLFAPTTINIKTEGGNSRTFCCSKENTTSGASYTNSYYTTVLQAVDGGKQPFTITADEGVTTLANAGTATEYTVSGITGYGMGIKYNNVLYAGNGDEVSLTLGGSTINRYLVNNQIMEGTSNPYALTMPNSNVVISAWNLNPPTEIASVDDWNNFCSSISVGFDYAGETVTMTANVGTTENPVNTIACDNSHFFRGTFDGGGKTLTIGYGSSESYSTQECAPFYRLENATIQNLKIVGSIYSSAQHNASLAVKATGENNLVQNCVSSVSINSSIEGDCTNGGFIGILNNNGTRVHFDGCAFTGELVGENATNWGGFVGWREYQNSNYNAVDFTYCLFAPTNINIATPNGSNSRTFCRSKNNTTSGASYTNSYYTEVLQDNDSGKRTYSFADNEVPVNIGDPGDPYTTSGITPYTSGLFYDALYYMSPEVISLADNAANNVDDIDKYFADVTLTGRTLYRDESWNTLCLPFDVTLADSPLAGAEARTLSEATFSAGTLTLNFGDPVTTLTAGTPYIIKWNKQHLADLIISNTEDWNAFATAVNGGNSYSGKVILLNDDITVETMVGTSSKRFKGTFDGGGHTLTFTYGTEEDPFGEDYCAPFHFVENATIANLHTAGTIYTKKKFGTGLVGYTKGTTVINNCWSSVEINSSVEGDGSHGGFVGYTEENASNTMLTNCLFDGSITGANTHSCGGLIGWNYGTASLANCVFRPTDITLAENSNNATFSRGSNVTVTNCYYSEELPGASGQGAAIGEMSDEALLAELGSGWQVKAGKLEPVVSKTNATSIVSPIFYCVTINATASTTLTPTGDGKVSFKGIYSPEELPGGNTSNLYLGADNQLYWPTADRTINAFRGYFHVEGLNNVREIRMNFGDDVTGVTLIDNGQLTIDNYAGADEWYDLLGRKLNSKPTQKGIYIHNGKKVMIP